MPRVKRGTMTHKRHKKIISRAEGYWGGRHSLFKTAKEAVQHSMQYAYRDRRNKKRDFRRLWIARISAACRANGVSYSVFMNGLSKSGMMLDRKVLSEMAIFDAQSFTQIVEQVRPKATVA
jgi:large subunit ribosomal protein L20